MASSDEETRMSDLIADESSTPKPSLPDGVERLVIVRQGGEMPLFAGHFATEDVDRIIDYARKRKAF